MKIPDPDEGYVASEVIEENGEELKVKVVNGPVNYLIFKIIYTCIICDIIF